MILWLGIALAGMLNGSFTVPMKAARVWKFAHIWGVFSLLAMAVLPWCGVLLAVPGWRAILAGIPGRGLAGLVTLGLIWGAASLLYGLAIDLLGIALGFSIQLGLSVAVGALVPFAAARGFALPTSADTAFLAGVALMIAGVIVCAGAGAAITPTNAVRFRKGLGIALLGGLGSPLLNFGIQYGISLLPGSSEGAGLGQWVAWSVFLSASAVSQVGFCFSRVRSARQAPLFRAPGSGHDFALVCGMSVIWAASIFLYGAGAAGLGRMGTSIGWPVFIGIIVITSNAWGVVLGEWRDRPKSRLYRMISGCAVLIFAAFVLGQTKPRW